MLLTPKVIQNLYLTSRTRRSAQINAQVGVYKRDLVGSLFQLLVAILGSNPFQEPRACSTIEPVRG